MWKFLSKWRYPKIIQIIGSDMLISMGKSMAWASGLLGSWHWLGSCRGVHRCHTPWPWPPWSGRWEPVLTHTISIVIQALKHPFWASYPLISCMPPHIICSFGMFWGFIMVAVGEVAKKGELTAPGFLTPNVSLTKPCSGTQEGVCHTFPI